MFTPIILLILIPLGFIGCAWATNSVFDLYKKDLDEVTSVDRLGTLFILMATFGTYCYLLFKLFLRE